MPDNDSNIIKPVEGLQTIAGLNPIKRRQERKRRQDQQEQNEEEPQQEINESFDEESLSNEPTETEKEQSAIDYRA